MRRAAIEYGDGEAEKFYRDLQQRAVSVRVGMEATGCSRRFERLLADLGIEVRIDDAAKIKTKRVRKQKTNPTPTIRNCCSRCSSKITFLACEYRAQKIVVSDSYFGAGIGWWLAMRGEKTFAKVAIRTKNRRAVVLDMAEHLGV